MKKPESQVLSIFQPTVLVVVQEMFNRSVMNVFILIIFFVCLYALKGAKKTNQQRSGERKGTRGTWSFGLLCAPQNCRDFENSRILYPLAGCSNSRRLRLPQNPYRHFCGARQVPIGKSNPFALHHAPLRGLYEASCFARGYSLDNELAQTM